jgi:tetratricopeptide (TPR) repeat protein
MDTSEITLAAARQEHQRGNLRQVEQIYTALVNKDPNQAAALHGLGSISYQQGQYEQAIIWLRKAVTCAEANAVLHCNLGAAYRATGRLHEAEACYCQALILRPDFAEAYNNLGNVLKLLGRLDEAAARYQQAILARSNYAEAHNNLGLVFWEQGKREEALAQFEQAVRLRPEFADAHANGGLVLCDLGRRDEAVARLREALRLQPGEASHAVNLAAALQEQGSIEAAVAHLREALRLRPDLAEAHQSLGIALLRENHLEEAGACFAQALRLRPDWLEVHVCLGRLCLRQGQLDKAIAHFRLAPRLQPRTLEASSPPLPRGQDLWQQEEAVSDTHPPTDSAEAHRQLALVLKRQRKLDEAILQCHEALRLDPEFAAAHETLGTCLAEQGRLEEAVTAFQQALRIKPDLVRTYVHLGTALREQGRLEKAVAYLRHALTLRPELAEAHRQLGLALTEQGRPDDAMNAYREAWRLEPDSAQALGCLGILLEEEGRAEEGHVLVEQALSFDPNNVQARVQYGTSLVNQGRFEEAKGQFLKALALQPDFAPAYYLLARDSDHQFSEAEAGRIKDLLNRDHVTLRDRISLHFALARLYDRAGSFEVAFHHCHQGNLCKQELLHLQGNWFQSAAHAQLVDRLVATFDQEYFRRVESFGNVSDLPVFIVGMPRSGTSLVEQILASHPAVYGAGELKQLTQLTAALPAELGSPVDYPECLDRLDQAKAARLAEQYVGRLRDRGGDRQRVTDKMPTNFHHLGLIATLLPRGHIIHCRRDPRDVCWSCYFQNFRDVHFVCDLATLGGYYQQYERLMGHWKAVLPMPVLEVCYEELVEDLEGVSRRIVAFCDLPWHDACLSFYKTLRTVRTSSNRQVRRPVYKRSVGYWKNYEAHLGLLLEALGPGERQ